MSVVKKTSEYTISKRRDGRFSIVDASKKPVNGDDKVKILLAEDLIKVKLATPPAAEEAPAEEAPAGEEGEEAAAE